MQSRLALVGLAVAPGGALGGTDTAAAQDVTALDTDALRGAWFVPDALPQVVLAPDARAVSGACVVESVDAVPSRD